MAATLFGEAVVSWRTSDGRVHAMRDLCIHRGTALSLGWIAGDLPRVLVARVGLRRLGRLRLIFVFDDAPEAARPVLQGEWRSRIQ